MSYKIGFIIGRFQIFHNGHLECLKKAFEECEKVFIFVGSSNQARTIENPFLYIEREEVIIDILKSINVISSSHCEIFPIEDFIYDDERWKKQIIDIIGYESSVAIIGGSKGEWYFDLFPEYAHLVPNKILDIDATKLRSIFFDSSCGWPAIKKIDKVPSETISFLREFELYSKWYSYILREISTKQKLNNVYGLGPFLTVDSFVIQNNKILLIKRKNHPGEGLWALPGGYFDVKDKSLLDGAIRELKEETSIDISEEDLKNYNFHEHIFDHPKRSSVARLITSAYGFNLPIMLEVTCKADDDASSYEWKDYEWIKNNKDKFYDDHFSMIDYFMNW